MDYSIELSESEASICCLIGGLRRITSRVDNIVDRHSHDKEKGWGYDIEACGAEMAVAKFLNVYWEGHVRNFHGHDVAGRQVRHCVREDACLIIREHDKDEDKFILVVGLIPTFRIAGWELGKLCKQDKWLKNPPPEREEKSWFVPQTHLRKMPDPMTLKKST